MANDGNSKCRRTRRDGRLEESAARYGQCVGLRPNFAWPHYNLALLHVGKEQWQAAERELLEAIRVDSELAPAHADLGAVAFRQGDFRRAESCLNRAIQLGLETSQTLLHRAAAREALHDHGRAREDLRAALRIDPDNQEAQQRLRRLE